MSVVMILVFVSFFEVGLGPIPWLIGAEIFPNRIRSEAMGISSTINWMSNFAVGLSFPSLSLALGPYSFVPFGLVLLVAFVLQYWFVPETQGKSLEEIQEEFLQQAGLIDEEERDEEEGRSSSGYGDATPSRLAEDLSEADEDEEEDDDLCDSQQVSATAFHQSQRNGQQRSYTQGSPQSAQGGGGGGDTPATPIPEESEERESQSGSGKD